MLFGGRGSENGRMCCFWFGFGLDFGFFFWLWFANIRGCGVFFVSMIPISGLSVSSKVPGGCIQRIVWSKEGVDSFDLLTCVDD